MGNFTKIGNFAITFEHKTLEIWSKAQTTRIFA